MFAYLRATFNDSGVGNNDGVPHQGKKVNMQTWIKNWGNMSAINVIGKLRSSDINASIQDSLKTLGTITVKLGNIGDGNGYNVVSKLYSYDNRLIILVLDSIGRFGNIAHETTGTNALNRFRLYASPQISSCKTIICLLRIIAEGNFQPKHLHNTRNVKPQIFNITDNLAKTLINSKQNNGFYKIHWNGKNENGERVAQGVYFVKLENNQKTIINKLRLIK